MSEVELVLLNDTDNCTLYSIQFTTECESEYERFYSKFIHDATLNRDLLKIVQIVDKIAEKEHWKTIFARKENSRITYVHCLF